MAVLLPGVLFARRGWVVGVAATLFYGAIAAALIFARDRFPSWSAKHPALDAACFGPFLFFALAYLTSLPTTTCLLIGLAGAAAVGGARRRRRLAETATRGIRGAREAGAGAVERAIQLHRDACVPHVKVEP